MARTASIRHRGASRGGPVSGGAGTAATPVTVGGTAAGSTSQGIDHAAFVRQRKDDGARAVREARAAAHRTIQAITDRGIRRSHQQGLADQQRAIPGFWATFTRAAPRQRGGGKRTGDRKGSGRAPASDRVLLRLGTWQSGSATHGGERQLAAYAGPVLDRHGRQGVYLSIRYLAGGRASRGCARRLVSYITKPAKFACEEEERELTGSNVAETPTEARAAFDTVEELNRAARANAKVVFHLVVQLPFDVSPQVRAGIMREWCEDVFGSHDLPYVWAVHAPDAAGDQRNHHGHVAASFRPMVRVAPFTWEMGRELRTELDDQEGMRLIRQRFAEVMTDACADAGCPRTFTAQSYAARGMRITPLEHLGAERTRAVRRGEYVAADARNRDRITRNEALMELDRLKQQQTAFEGELARTRIAAARIVEPVRPAVHPFVANVPAVASALQAASSRLQRSPTHAALARAPAPSDRKAACEATRVVTLETLRPGAKPPQRTPETQVGVFGIASTPRPIPATASRIAATPAHSSIGAKTPDRVIATIAPVASPILVGSPAATCISLQPAKTGGTDAAKIATAAPALLPLPPLRTSRIRRVAAVDDPGGSTSSVILSVRARQLVRPNVSKLARSAPASGPTTTPASLIDQPAIAALFGEADAGRRDLAKTAAQRRRRRRMLATIGGIEWSDHVVDDVVPFDQVKSIDKIPTFAAVSAAALVEHLRAVDYYVHAAGDGRPTLAAETTRALRIGPVEVRERIFHKGLADIRADQQRIMAMLATDAERRPLAFGKAGPRPWPRDLDVRMLERLDRWSSDRDFASEYRASIGRAVAEAHRTEEQRRRIGRGQPERAGTRPTSSPSITDGTGNTRNAPAPDFVPVGDLGVRIRAFHADTDKPTDQLLMLVQYAGEHPRRIVPASDGRLMTVETPMLIATLMAGWRHDERVHALVSHTVRASLAAGLPAWPDELAPLIRARRARGATGNAGRGVRNDLSL